MVDTIRRLIEQHPEAFDAGDTPVGRNLSTAYVLDLLPAHVHQALAAKAGDKTYTARPIAPPTVRKVSVSPATLGRKAAQLKARRAAKKVVAQIQERADAGLH